MSCSAPPSADVELYSVEGEIDGEGLGGFCGTIRYAADREPFPETNCHDSELALPAKSYAKLKINS
jgi:hypothetical protein